MGRLQPMGAPGDLLRGVEFTGLRARQRPDGTPRRAGVVESVEPGGPGARAGIRPGDGILSVNGHRLRDVVDYQFYSSDALVELEVSAGPEFVDSRVIRILKDAGQSLGLTFTQPTFTPIRECNNHCPFCFIDQLPGEMRSPLYIRDDDYRYSFLFGNFVTLTNLNGRDWQRLEEQRLSPLYVSVHSTDQSLRRLLLGNERAPDVLEQLDRLFAMGIKVHTQVVLCPGRNDGRALESTLADLCSRHPNVLSVGVVPVGLTRTPAEILAGPGASCSRILPSAVDLQLRTFRPNEAAAVVRHVQAWRRRCRREHGVSVVHASDELYLLSGARLPSAAMYDEYPQYENGIGMVRDLIDDWTATKRRLRRGSRLAIKGTVTLVCGEMIAPVLRPMVKEWSELTGGRAELVVLENRFFGPRVTVSGLLTGGDVLANRDRLRGDVVILPEVMLDKTGMRLLDNVTPSELEAELGRPVRFGGMMSKVTRIAGAWAAEG